MQYLKIDFFFVSLRLKSGNRIIILVNLLDWVAEKHDPKVHEYLNNRLIYRLTSPHCKYKIKIAIVGNKVSLDRHLHLCLCDYFP